MKGKGSSTSTSFRESDADQNHRVTRKIGCIPGIFFFFHRHGHHRSRKLISCSTAKNQSTDINADPVQRSYTTRMAALSAVGGSPDVSISKGCESRKVSCDVPRSPTLPAEIRRSNSTLVGGETESIPGTPRKTPSLVVRLMGLDELPEESSPPSADEKRRKLLGALEKCDEDLKALKRIIDAVSLADSRNLLLAGATEDARELAQGRSSEKKRCSQLQLSPVSVINGLSSLSTPEAGRGRQADDTRDKEKIGGRKNGGCRKPPPMTKSERRADLFRPTSVDDAVKGVGRGRVEEKEDEGEDEDEEVWRQGFGGDLGWVGVALEDGILWDLVVEVVEELRRSGGAAGCISPFDACRRRLCF